jgi:hypothetical protein
MRKQSKHESWFWGTLLNPHYAFIVVVFDVAKSFIEDRVQAKFMEKNT